MKELRRFTSRKFLMVAAGLIIFVAADFFKVEIDKGQLLMLIALFVGPEATADIVSRIKDSKTITN